MKSIILLSCWLSLTSSSALSEVYYNDVAESREVSTPPPPHRPYAFGYAAGRYPGHIDRTHSEVSDGLGVVQGSYSYVDPRQQIRTVEYISDKDGFRQISNQHVPDLPTDTPVVAAAKLQHLRRFSAIAQANQVAPDHAVVPVDTKAVQYAKNKHFILYQQIAEEHARMAAELDALKRKEEAKTRANGLSYGDHIY